MMHIGESDSREIGYDVPGSQAEGLEWFQVLSGHEQVGIRGSLDYIKAGTGLPRGVG